MSNNRPFGNGICAMMVLALVTAPAAANEEEWEFSVAPLFLWAKNIEGSSAIGGKEAPLDLDFQDDILDNLDSAFTVHFEAKKGVLTLYAEYNYAVLDPTTSNTIGPAQIEAAVEFTDIMWEAGATWTFAQSRDSSWELLGGIRYMDQDIDVKISREGGPGIIPLPDRIGGGDDWWQGVAGLRYTATITDTWSLKVRGDLGYGDSDNKSLHGIAFFDNRFRDWGSFFFGYRYLDTDYDNGRSGDSGYAFDGNQQGPVIGLNFHF
ncbi:MAG: hypothetical protein V7696_01130 [Halioglobus sp.]